MRNKCKIEGCTRLGRNKGFSNNKIHYGNTCEVHHKKTDKIPSQFKRQLNKRCINCGWNKGPCDRHRVIPSLGYIDSNVMILCPNCHRLITMGLLVIYNS